MSSTTIESVKKSKDMMQVVDAESILEDVHAMMHALQESTSYEGPYVLYYVDPTTQELRTAMVNPTAVSSSKGVIDLGSTSAEIEFKMAVLNVVHYGEYPSPTSINKEMGRDPRRRKMNNLNDRECRWRREICKEIGFTLRGKNL